MKKTMKLIGIISIVVVIGFTMATCATNVKNVDAGVTTDKRGDDDVQKTIIITGFNLPGVQVNSFSVQVASGWDDDKNTWIIDAFSTTNVDGKPSQILDGQTITAPLWKNNPDKEGWILPF